MNASLAARSTFSKTASICLLASTRHVYRTCLYSQIAWSQTAQGLQILDVACPSRKQVVKLIDGKRNCHIRASIDEKESSQITDSTKKEGDAIQEDAERPGTENGAACKEEFPSGDLDFKKSGLWGSFVMRLKMLCTVPWQRVKKGSVLKLKLSGKVTEQFQGRFTPVLSLPQICQNLIKAAYDPRISGVYLQIEPLDCGWGKIEEIRRHILFFKKSGKFIISYMTVGGEKEYYLARTCQELYVPPGAYVTLYGLKVQATFLGG
ncbi:hypothetical protein L7F22_012575 [Adiantum nelumboides]|nr:hypothetical protein [Adiantum nelumboides]